jgi:hypothetical protein
MELLKTDSTKGIQAASSGMEKVRGVSPNTVALFHGPTKKSSSSFTQSKWQETAYGSGRGSA